MRITNSMMRNNSLWSINKNEELMNKYDRQISSGKKIQKPSDDPIVAVRALKFRTNVREIKQFKTNSEDATSWLSVNEQSMSNTINLLKRARDLTVQGASDIYSKEDRESIMAEFEQIKTQFMNEGNVNYAGRYIYSGFKTDKPLTFTATNTSSYTITEHFKKTDVEKMQKVIGSQIEDVYRMRLPYSEVGPTAALPVIAAGLTINVMDSTSTTPDAYKPGLNEVHFIKDTGELIFNENNVKGITLPLPSPPTVAIPANFDFAFTKNNFKKGDMVPEHYFDCTNNSLTPAVTYTKPNDQMVYQISYNQELVVNTMGNKVFTSDMARDFEEIINVIKNVPADGSLTEALQKDLLGNFFDGMLTKLDKHINTVVREEAIVGSKINRLDLTISRLEDDKINFTELMSLNEDVDMTEAVLSLKAQEIVYNASLMSSSSLMQKSLIDFIR